MFTIGESRAIFPSDDTELNSKQKKWLEILDFQPKLHREHRLAQQRRQHSDHKHVQRQRQKTTISNIGFLQWALFYHEQFITPIMCDM